MTDLRKYILITLGTIFVALGVIGMFLPLVPTTIFLLLAAYCYSRSSERFYTWLITNRWCGEYIRNWREGRGMTAAHKVKALLLLWASIAFSTWYTGGKLWLTAILVIVAGGVTIYLLSIPTYRPGSETADLSPADETA